MQVYIQNTEVVTNEEPLPSIDWDNVFATNEKKAEKEEEPVTNEEGEEPPLPGIDWEAMFRR